MAGEAESGLVKRVAEKAVEEPRGDHALATYRYLRIGIISAVLLLGTSIVLEYFAADRVRDPSCWQTSISAYYYTPVRTIFVGVLIAIGLSLIVIKGRTILEDVCLNFAGMLAPVVAVIPTTAVGGCWSIQPSPEPKPNGELAGWVIAIVDNNFESLLWAGALGLVVSLVLAVAMNGGPRYAVNRLKPGTMVSLALTAIAILIGYLLQRRTDFYEATHGPAAIAMFVFLVGAVVGKALQPRKRTRKPYLGLYSFVAVAMVVGAVVIGFTSMFGDHKIFALETFEIVAFAVFWIIQTVETWDEEPSAALPAL